MSLPGAPEGFSLYFYYLLFQQTLLGTRSVSGASKEKGVAAGRITSQMTSGEKLRNLEQCREEKFSAMNIFPQDVHNSK